MKLMKAELGVAQLADSEDMEDENSKEYHWAQELLSYREYQFSRE